MGWDCVRDHWDKCVCMLVCISVCGPDLSRDPGCWKAKVSLSLQLTPLCCRLRVCVPVCGDRAGACFCVWAHTCVLCFWTCVCVIEGGESWKVSWVSVSVDFLQTPPALPWQLPVARSRPGYAGSYLEVNCTTPDPTDTSPLHTHSHTQTEVYSALQRSTTLLIIYKIKWIL